MPGTWTVKDHIPTAEDWENTSWILDIGAAKHIPLGTVIAIDANRELVMTPPDGIPIKSEGPVEVSEAGLINGNFLGLKEWMVGVLSMIVLVGPRGREERHITLLSMIGDPDNVGVMGGTGGGGSRLERLASRRRSLRPPPDSGR